MSRTARLWAVLAANLALVGALVVVGFAARSLGVWSEAVDYLGDAAGVAVALLAYTWQRYECLDMRYQLQQTSQQQAKVLELNRELRVELATLRSPERIDLLARNQLGMTVPQPAQIISIEPQTAGEMADASTDPNPTSIR